MNKSVHIIAIIGILFIMIIMVYMTSSRFEKKFIPSLPIFNLTSKKILLSKHSKWEDDKLVVIPAIYKEINWTNRSSWPRWLVDGLDPQSSYRVHLYQRIDPNSTAPYDWPYCANRHEETGVYLQFIYEYYYDLPKKMLFIHGEPLVHSPSPIEMAQCIRNDVHYTSINPGWFADRSWRMWVYTENDTIGHMYRCANYILSLFGFDGESQLNPKNMTPKSNSTITAPCCAQFFVTRERIRHYTYEQWSAVYGANLRSYCVSPEDTEMTGERDHKWFGGSFEHLWHVILGFHPNDMELPERKTTSDLCHSIRSSCKNLGC